MYFGNVIVYPSIVLPDFLCEKVESFKYLLLRYILIYLNRFHLTMPFIPPRLSDTELLVWRFHNDTPTRSDDVDIELEVIFHDETFGYKVKISLYEHGTGIGLKWVSPPPNVHVTYCTDSTQVWEESFPLKFDDERYMFGVSFEGTLEDTLDDIPWREFLFIGLRFDACTVNYYVMHPNGDMYERTIEETRKFSLVSYNTYGAGPETIWGKRYFGHGKYLDAAP